MEAGRATTPALPMTRREPFPRQGPQFDDFLFAPVDADRNGGLLSVVSLLARADLDPWQEAASLAALPAETASQRLATLILALPGGPQQPEAGNCAARLIALLPVRGASASRGLAAPPRVAAATPPARSLRALLLAVLVALVVCAQFVIANRNPASHGGDAHEPTAPAVSQNAPSAVSGR